MANETPETSRFEPLSALWGVFVAPQTLLVLMALIALALALSSLIPQIPPQAMSDPQAWLAMQTGLFGQASDLIQVLGLFDLYHSFGFRLLLVLTGLCLFVRLVESIELAWRAMGRNPWPPQARAYWGKFPPQFRLGSSLSMDEVRARLDEFLEAKGFWWTDVSGPLPSLIMGGRRPVLWARVLGYSALLLALAGLVVEGDWGWLGEQWQPVPGESRVLGLDTPYSIRLDDFTLHLDDDQRLKDYQSELTWLQGETELERVVIGVGRPTTHQGVTVRQVGFVPLVRIRGWDGEGRPLTLETEEDVFSMTGETAIRFTSPEAQPVVLISEYDLFLALSFDPACAEKKPVLYVDRVHGDAADRQVVGVLHESGKVSVDGLRLEVDLSFVPILLADHRPAMGLVVASMALVVVALIASWILPYWLAWLTVGQGRSGETYVQVSVLPGAAARRCLPRLADLLGEVLADDS